MPVATAYHARSDRAEGAPDDAAFARELDEEKRVILRITPDTVLMND